MSDSGHGNWGAPPGGGGPFGPAGGSGPFGPPGGGPFGTPGAAPPGGGYGAPPGGGYGAPPGGQFPPVGPPGYGPPAAWGAPPPPSNKNRTLLIVGAIAGVAVLCTVCAVVGYLYNKQTQETYGALTAACEGRPVAGARNYVPGPSVHRVVGAEQAPNGAWRIANSRIPNNQLAQGIYDAEAVLCFGNETRVNVGSCDFYSTRMGIRVPGSQRTYQRTQQALPVRVVAATTGMVITTGNVVGPAPPQCNQSVGRPSSGTFQGSSVNATHVGTWLQSVLSTGGMGMVPM